MIQFPPLTPTVKKLIVWNVAIFAVSVVLSFSQGLFDPVMRYLALQPQQFGSEAPFLPFWQVVTYGFLHSVDGLAHVAFNMLGLYFFGTLLEHSVGSKRLVVTYFGAMLAGALLHIVMSKVLGTPNPAVGASGAVLGVLVAAAVLNPKAPVIFLIFPMTLATMAMIVLAMDAFAIITMLRDGSRSGVAHWVHLGGAIFGFLWARLGYIQVDWGERYREEKAKKQAASDRDDAQRMDDLLAKINREGIASLSNKEREFLKKMSKKQ